MNSSRLSRPAQLAAVVSLLGALAAIAAGPVPGTVERRERFALASGSKLRVTLPVGRLRVVSSREPAVRVFLSVKLGRANPELERQIDIRFRPGPQAELEIRVPEGVRRGISGFLLEAEVSVPQETHLEADLGVGELRVRGVEGDLRAHVGVGELVLELSNPALYKQVRAEAGIGELRHPFRGGDRERGWLGKKFESRFPSGRYKLEADVGVGDLRISEAAVL